MIHEGVQPQQPNDFDSLVASVGPPSIETQRGLLETLQQQQSEQWQATGISGKIVDAMHMGDGERTVTLGRVFERQTDGTAIEQHYFYVGYHETMTTGQTSSTKLSYMTIPVSRSYEGVMMPEPPFDDEDAVLVDGQIKELQRMKDDGELPNLSGNLDRIYDPSQGMLMLAKPEDEKPQEDDKTSDRILSPDEINEWVKDQGYEHVTRGTYRNESTYMYIKSCLRMESEADAMKGLEVARYLTDKGIVHPATTWGVFQTRSEKPEYQVFAVSPAIEAWSIERIGTEEENRFGRYAAENAPHIVEWVRRIDPEYEPGQPAGLDSLVGMLNLTEASHPDNWGWDPITGVNYPVDIEVMWLADHVSAIKHQPTTTD